MPRALLALALFAAALPLAGCGGSPAGAPPPTGTPPGIKVRLDVEVLVDGETRFAPSVVFLAGEEAEVRIEEEGREPFVLRVDAGMMVHVRAPIYDDAGALAGMPDVTLRPGESSRVTFSIDAREYQVEIRSTPQYLGGVDSE